ncbi:dihydrofolate reductase [Methylobacterium currus]|uniref:dihydrofolate reductase n=1 Tax=Methylobacterium currus TaxID=2051553 RepID=UPI0013DFC63D|nr:dihydrofolate reductase [Methylobacterium currus]
MTDITLIAAIGQQGQLGLRGELPWKSNWGHAYRADLWRFRETTTGGVLIAGYRTIQGLWGLDGTHDRDLVEDDLRWSPDEIAARIAKRWPERPVFVIGGAKTYRRWLDTVTAFDVTRLPYDGEADVHAEFLLPHVTLEVAA